jgi:hypothetical protein
MILELCNTLFDAEVIGSQTCYLCQSQVAANHLELFCCRIQMPKIGLEHEDGNVKLVNVCLECVNAINFRHVKGKLYSCCSIQVSYTAAAASSQARVEERRKSASERH